MRHAVPDEMQINKEKDTTAKAVRTRWLLRRQASWYGVRPQSPSLSPTLHAVYDDGGSPALLARSSVLSDSVSLAGAKASNEKIDFTLIDALILTLAVCYGIVQR